ncbi:male-specific lethal 3 homolog isoform X2 [Patiria miniata]|uniref:Chromo domain-containing protein n=1 Tax=Patiria miniata TaxID=46514 RepID=A0A913Z1Q3_PATMI|nr:male-specific lethal 3 homolog isoform X2 [Patiria miniata]
MTTSVIATRGLKPAEFSVGEHVLCFEPDPTKARVLYDSKILEVEWTKDEVTNKRVPEYLVHFNGWNSSWDRWAPAHYILRYTDENLELKGKLHRQALAKMGKKKKKKTLTELVELARRRKAGKGSDSDMSSGVADSDDSDDSSSELEAVEIPIPLPEALKMKLEDDCYFITRKNQLVKLPCEHNILTLMEGYIRHFAINVQIHEKKKSQSQNVVNTVAKEGLVVPPQPKYNVDLCKEVMDGLRIIFDFLLPTNLLYSIETEQYKKIVTSCYVKDMAPEPETPSPPKRGRPRKHSVTSSPTKEPAKPDTKDSPEKSKDETLRRVTRRLSTSEQITLTSPLPPVKRRCSDADHPPRSPYPKRHSVDTPSHNKDSSAVTNTTTSKPVLRHSTRLSSVSSIPSSPTPETQPEVAPFSRSESTESNQSSSNNGKATNHNGKNFGINVCDMKLPSCKLLDDDANYDGRMPPCKMYGAQHLMRLFVKLPELLGKMDLPPKKLRPLLKHIELFLKYLAHPDRLEEFFPESAYVSPQEALQQPKET